MSIYGISCATYIAYVSAQSLDFLELAQNCRFPNWKRDSVYIISFRMETNYDWHNAPCKQYIIMLDAGVEIQVGHGTMRIVNPEAILLA